MPKSPDSSMGCAPLAGSEPSTQPPYNQDVPSAGPEWQKGSQQQRGCHLYQMGTSALGMGKVKVNKNTEENSSTGRSLIPSTGLGLPAAMAFMTK